MTTPAVRFEAFLDEGGWWLSGEWEYPGCMCMCAVIRLGYRMQHHACDMNTCMCMTDTHNFPLACAGLIFILHGVFFYINDLVLALLGIMQE